MKKLTLLMAAILFAAFVSAQTKTEIKPDDLMKPIKEYIAKNYQNWTIDKAFKVDTKSTITFEVLISKDPERLVLTFDKDGKLVAKASEGKAQPKPVTKPPIPEKAKKK